jgi:serine/threonine-protein kinase RsbT
MTNDVPTTDTSPKRERGDPGGAAQSDVCIPIRSEGDIVVARQQGRNLAAPLGFSRGDLALIATAISELARNIIQYATQGEVIVKLVQSPRRGIVVVVRDQGPGIADLNLALQDGYSTGGGLGLGLPGAKRLMDEFDVVSEVGKGTTVTIKKWVR